MKQELQKLQQESKSGQKSKDVATKDLDAAKKKLQEVEAKLKVITSDKQAALQVKQLSAACSTFYLAAKGQWICFQLPTTTLHKSCNHGSAPIWGWALCSHDFPSQVALVAPLLILFW